MEANAEANDKKAKDNYYLPSKPWVLLYCQQQPDEHEKKD